MFYYLLQTSQYSLNYLVLYINSSYIDEEMKRDSVNKSKLSAVSKSLKAWAEKKSIAIEGRSQRMKDRDKKVVTKCFHGAGLVVPVDKNGVGYRELPETPGLRRRRGYCAMFCNELVLGVC